MDIKLSSDDDVNAYTDGSTITVNLPLVEQANDDELAMVIGHEMAHVTLSHNTDTVTSSRNKEALADKLGSFYMMKAGYDLCKGKMIFLKFTHMFGDCADCDHPSNAYRIEELSMPQCPVQYWAYIGGKI